MKPRNPFAIVVKKRKAGSHRKSNKALRKQEKQARYGETVSQRTFNPSSSSSNLDAWTIYWNTLKFLQHRKVGFRVGTPQSLRETV